MVSTIEFGSIGTAVGIWVGTAAADDEEVACRMAADACAAAASVRSVGGTSPPSDMLSSVAAQFAVAGICPGMCS